MTDVEMNEVHCHLLENEQLKENNDVKVPDVEFKSSEVNAEFTGLTKEELEKYAKDPFWKKLRLILFIVFWVIWLGMLIVAVLIVVLSPKCPKRPKLEFWEKKTGYWVDTLGFVDTNGDGVGDFDGLITKLNYIQKELGAGYLILDPIFAGQFSNDQKIVGSVDSFRTIDKSIGNLESFKKLLKEGRKRGMEIVMSADFNSLLESSTLIQNDHNVFVKWDTKMQSWLSRDGKSTLKKFKGQDYYSSSPEKSKMLDLNLTNIAVLNEIKDSVKFWLDLGVRGFLLTNTAFYTENLNVPAIPTTYGFGNTWYSQLSMNGQIFSNDTSIFLKEIRSVLDGVAKKTDKSRVLILDAGNVGFGLPESNEQDSMLQYLGGSDRIADMVISREFLSNRGWSVDKDPKSKSSVNNYLKMAASEKRNRIALTSATSWSLRISSLQKLSAPFLLPGNPLLYFGSELDIKCNTADITVNVPFYPKSHTFPLDNLAGEKSTKCNHMIMPWDNTGLGFYNDNHTSSDKYITTAVNTVQGLTAIGAGESVLQLHQKLIKIRENPSLQWGNIAMFLDEKTATGSYEIFIREADGFPKIIVAIIKDSIEGRVFTFSTICGRVKPLIVYPENINLPEEDPIESSNIYLKIHKTESLHVFQCVD